MSTFAAAVGRITKELSDIQKGQDLSLAVAYKESDVRYIQAMIIGPPKTPYEFGFFEFRINCSKNYPREAPKVQCITTNQGQTRFNPNIYSEGKVCLSILGTWRGEPGEEWSSAQGLESILWSIQSLMSSNPWENEPGFETCETDEDKKAAELYALKIHHETIRITVVQRLEDYLGIEQPAHKETGAVSKFGGEPDDHFDDLVDPFQDLCKQRFMWYYPSYMASIAEAGRKWKKACGYGVKFQRAPFESSGNGMDGAFQYDKLTERLRKINEALKIETAQMEALGKSMQERESPTALAFQNHFKSVSDNCKNSDTPLDVEMVDGNPFVWRLLMFGRPMTNFDGGIFKVKIVIPVSFPQEMPRVRVETPLFHQRISPEGVLCYFPKKSHEIASHVQAIVEAIEDESPPYDPRTVVHPEASNLFWGKPEDKKVYNRKLRRSVQESSEY